MYDWGLVTTGDASVVSTAYADGEASATTACCGWLAEPYMDLAFKTYVAPSGTGPTNNPLPALSSISPTSARAGGQGVALTVTGTNFVPTSVVRWNGTDLVTTPDPTTPTTKLSASLPATAIATMGTSEITVFSPVPGGGTSIPVDFFVTDTGAAVDASTNVSGFTTAQLSSASASGGTVNLSLTPSPGNGTLTLAHYAGDPVTVPAPLPSSNFYDVHVSPGSTFTSLKLVICNGGNLVYWWDSATNRWLQASPQQPDPTQPGCVDVTLTPQSAPNLTQLAGTPFVVASDTTPPTTRATAAPGPVPSGEPLVSVSASGTVQTTTGATLGKLGPIQCWNSRGLLVTLVATDSGAGVKSLAYSASGAQPIASTTAAGGTVVLPTVSAAGLTTVVYAATDKVGNQQANRSLGVVVGSVDEGKIAFACAAPTPSFAMPAHGILVLTGTATLNGFTVPFSKTLHF
jgi:hypothetical protein